MKSTKTLWYHKFWERISTWLLQQSNIHANTLFSSLPYFLLFFSKMHTQSLLYLIIFSANMNPFFFFFGFLKCYLFILHSLRAVIKGQGRANAGNLYSIRCWHSHTLYDTTQWCIIRDVVFIPERSFWGENAYVELLP